jgi:hypothetical protein
VRHALQDLVLFKVFGLRNHDRAVEGQLARLNPLERFHHRPQHRMALKHSSAKAFASQLDSLGQRDLLLAREQRDRGHLCQIETDRIVAGPPVFFIEEAAIATSRPIHAASIVLTGSAAFGLRLVDQLDAVLLHG